MTLTTLRLSEGGQTVSYRDHGTGVPLVLIHGVGLQSAAWGPQIDALQDICRVIAVDMPGHGGSDPLPTGSTLSDFVSWGWAFIRELGLGPVNLAGHSMGALIAGGLACEYPALICRVALLNGVFQRDPTASQAVIARAQQIEAGQTDLHTPLTRWFGTAADAAPLREQVGAWLSQVDQRGYATAYAAFARGDATYADQYSQITCPFLAITGDGDPNSTPAMSTAMANRAPSGKAVTIHGHRHMINLTAPDAVNQHLRHWLQCPTAKGHCNDTD